MGSLLVPGTTCWRIETATRVAVIVDAAPYFKAVREAILQARHSVLLIGWDFDTRVTLDHAASDGAPARLGSFLLSIAKARPSLQVHVLKWDLGTLAALGRGSTPLMMLLWKRQKNIHFKLDSAHPKAAAHHQKIVVIDDVLAFCGGIDITADRWDTRDHRDDDPHRLRPTTRRPYGPWHDATAAVDGALARALGDLARARWQSATGETLSPPPPVAPIWPSDLAPQFRNRPVGVARTLPAYREQSEVREIERFYLAAIAAARRSIYIESQYFAARRIAEALAARLREPDGPEVVVINPQAASGWLEEAVMGAARARLVDLLRQDDRDRRFGLFFPVTEAGDPIYVHAKIMIVDDRLLRLGSSNLNNRSLGYDTECDLILEAEDDAEVGSAIRRLRDGLLAEHLGRSRNEVAAALAEKKSLLKMIDALAGPGRSLRRLQPEAPPVIGEALAENDLLDPEGIAPRRWSPKRLMLTRRA